MILLSYFIFIPCKILTTVKKYNKQIKAFPIGNFNEFHLSLFSLLAEALFLVFADGRKETSAMGRKWLY